MSHSFASEVVKHFAFYFKLFAPFFPSLMSTHFLDCSLSQVSLAWGSVSQFSRRGDKSVWNGLTAFFSHYGYHTKLILCNFLFPLSLCCLKNCNSLGKWFYNVVTISSDSGTVPRFKQELRNIFRICFC